MKETHHHRYKSDTSAAFQSLIGCKKRKPAELWVTLTDRLSNTAPPHYGATTWNKSPLLHINVLTIFIGFILLDDVMCVSQRGLLSLFFHQEVHQVLRTHEARGLSVLSVDHGDFLPMGQQVVEMFDLLSSQVSGFGFVTCLYDESVTWKLVNTWT